MSGLPAGWMTARLGKVADVQLGKMLDRKRTEGTNLPYLRNVNVRWGHIDVSDLLEMPFKDQELDRYAVRPGDVMVCEGGEPGRAAVWTRDDQDIKYQKALHRVRVGGGLLPNWLVYQLHLDASSGRLAKQFTGTTIGHLPREAIVEYELRLAPVPEQHRIVEAIESYFTRLDDALATLERVQRNLKRYQASVLKAAVEGRLVPTEAELSRAEGRDYEPASALLERILAERRRCWQEAGGRAKYQEPASPDTRDLPELPWGWCWATVDQLSHEVRYGSSAKAHEEQEGGVPIVRMGNIVDGFLDFTDLKYLLASHDEFPDLLLQPGDLLFNRTNSAELVGKTAVFHAQREPCSFASYLIRVRMLQGVHPDFVSHYINSLAGRAWIASVVSQQVGQANVNGTKLRACPVPLPPNDEQHRIVGEVDLLLSVAFAMAGAAAADHQRCQRLRQSILKWAFEGKLADQDPSDEPATALLERIRSQTLASRLSAGDTEDRRLRRSGRLRSVRAKNKP